jgi:hypothetical protein
VYTEIPAPEIMASMLPEGFPSDRLTVSVSEEALLPASRADLKLMLCHGDCEGDEVAIFESIEMRNWLLCWYPWGSKMRSRSGGSRETV